MTGPVDPRGLADRWRELAEEVRTLGAEGQALTLEKCAEELVTYWREIEIRTVDTEEAVEISGFTASALRKMRAEGKLTDAGPGRYYLAELPRKPRLRKPRLATNHDLADAAVFSRARARDS